MGNVRTETATLAHVQVLAPEMRTADLREVRALGYASAFHALDYSVRTSDRSVAAFIDGDLAALLGVAELPRANFLSPRRGRAWLLTGEVVNRKPLSFFRSARIVLQQLRGDITHLHNFVDARYPAALHFLERLGWRIHAPKPLGVSGEPFHLVTLGD